MRGALNHLSASSRMTTLCRPGGKVTFFCAKALILFRTTSIPLKTRISRLAGKKICSYTHLSSDAFSSNTPSLYASPNNWCARQCMLVVFPIPGIPFQQLRQNCKKKKHLKDRRTEMTRWGTLPSFAMTFNREMVSPFPTTSSSTRGRYFSTLPRISFSVSSSMMGTYQGSSYGMSDPFALDAEVMRDASRRDKP